VKIPVAILTYRRPEYLAETLETFLEKNGKDRFSFHIFSQDTDEVTSQLLNKYGKLWASVWEEKQNKGCAAGYSFLMSQVANLGAPYIIHLQDDWRSSEPLLPYLDDLIKVMKEKRNIGYIRLRSIKSQVCSKNRITHKYIFYRWVSDHIVAGNGHFTLNPTFARTDVIKRMLPVVKELDAMHKYHDLRLLAGQLSADCFTHIGFARAMTEVGKTKVWIK